MCSCAWVEGGQKRLLAAGRRFHYRLQNGWMRNQSFSTSAPAPPPPPHEVKNFQPFSRRRIYSSAFRRRSEHPPPNPLGPPPPHFVHALPASHTLVS